MEKRKSKDTVPQQIIILVDGIANIDFRVKNSVSMNLKMQNIPIAIRIQALLELKKGVEAAILEMCCADQTDAGCKQIALAGRAGGGG